MYNIKNNYSAGKVFGDIITNYLFQIVFTVGIIILFGFAIGLLNKRFYANFGDRATAVCYATGFIGTPVHELSHALFCIIFMHRITEIRLFRINPDDGVLGYVNHTYNRRNIYARIGNFFIGVAPIIAISALLYLFVYLLMPPLAERIGAAGDALATTDIGAVFGGLWTVITAFFSYAAHWQWWVFILIGMLLSLHMTLSGADIRGALGGLFVTLAAVLVADIVLGVLGGTLLSDFTSAVMCTGGYLLCFFVIALSVSVLAVALSFVARLIMRRR